VEVSQEENVMTRMVQHHDRAAFIQAGSMARLLALGILFSSALAGLTARAQETVLHTFKNDPDGANPQARLLRDGAGNLYGVTTAGGSGHGTVFKLTANGSETILHAFTGGADGGAPKAGLIRDSAGNLYGTTYSGGTGPFGGRGGFQVDRNHRDRASHFHRS
jgi:uncharacterized repeat protein (TIGR03803 family)